MTRYEIAIQSKETDTPIELGCLNNPVEFKTCEEAFISIGLEYSYHLYACYNEEIGDKEQCPFAKEDTCKNKELPGHEKEKFSRPASWIIENFDFPGDFF